MTKYVKLTVGRGLEEGSNGRKNIEKRGATNDCINRRMTDNYASRLNRSQDISRDTHHRQDR
jgi:hypothetical protein